jgi:hypothetical protein
MATQRGTLLLLPRVVRTTYSRLTSKLLATFSVISSIEGLNTARSFARYLLRHGQWTCHHDYCHQSARYDEACDIASVVGDDAFLP